jgi:hypothetical protein
MSRFSELDFSPKLGRASAPPSCWRCFLSTARASESRMRDNCQATQCIGQFLQQTCKLRELVTRMIRFSVRPRGPLANKNAGHSSETRQGAFAWLRKQYRYDPVLNHSFASSGIAEWDMDWSAPANDGFPRERSHDHLRMGLGYRESLLVVETGKRVLTAVSVVGARNVVVDATADPFCVPWLLRSSFQCARVQAARSPQRRVCV